MVGGGLVACLPESDNKNENPRLEFDYVIIGSGPGGGPLAANLVKAGYTVALLEAGIDPLGAEAKQFPFSESIYKVPAFLGAIAEHPVFSWDFFVRHYKDEEQQRRDSKYTKSEGGVLYPRGSCIGGSAAHNAVIFVYPHNEDFDHIAELTGDESWTSENMHPYFERLERCEYLDIDNSDGHGFSGYMPTSVYDRNILELFPEIRDLAFAGANTQTPFDLLDEVEANNPTIAEGGTGTVIAPMHISNNTRFAIREYLFQTQEEHPGKLFIFTGALAQKVLFEGNDAVGVEFMVGANLYDADKFYNNQEETEVQAVYARKEVIVSGGAFNTPQLLMLSGVGDQQHLAEFDIDVLVDLPGVGRNLQDRYEVSVSAELKQETEYFSHCEAFESNDPCMQAYNTGKWVNDTDEPFYGPYAANGILGSRIVKSSTAVGAPDLFFAGAPFLFRGYFPEFSKETSSSRWTWVVLKAHNNNNAGRISLKSSDPRIQPLIEFNYFDEGNDFSEADLQAVLEGIKEVRGYLKDPQALQHISHEVLPGGDIQTDEEIKQFIKDEAWGHHASCSAKIGSDDDPMAVLDSRFRVRGVNNLRVVDASIFPRIPGFYPMAAILMISEKASDVIIEDAV